MQSRTNAMRIYNDCLIDNVARATGGDLMRISGGGSDADCVCAAWEGVIISISGKTKGFPTYDEARSAGCFHPNCVHTLEYVDEAADEKEIALQQRFPVGKEGLSADAADERKYEIDIARKMEQAGVDRATAVDAVDRDNLAANIRTGLVINEKAARGVVDNVSPRQITVLCKDGNPPSFAPIKNKVDKNQNERWAHGSRGGVIHLNRNTDIISSLTDIYKNEEVKNFNALTHKTFKKLVDDKQALSGVNPLYAENRRYQINCGRCCDAYELRRRGIDVTAMGTVGFSNLDKQKDYMQYIQNDGGGGWISMYTQTTPIHFGNSFSVIKNTMTKWGIGARAKIFIQWKGGGGHFFIAEQTKEGTIFINPQQGNIYLEKQLCPRVKKSKYNAFTRIDLTEYKYNVLNSVKS